MSNAVGKPSTPFFSMLIAEVLSLIGDPIIFIILGKFCRVSNREIAPSKELVISPIPLEIKENTAVPLAISPRLAVTWFVSSDIPRIRDLI